MSDGNSSLALREFRHLFDKKNTGYMSIAKKERELYVWLCRI